MRIEIINTMVSEALQNNEPPKEEHLKDVFNRFTQVNKQSPQKGAGLGLAIVKNLVELLQGNTTIKSTPNKGTTIAVNLSYKIDNLPKKKKTQAPTSVIEKLSTKHSIILVEHAEITQLSVLKIFAAHGQFYLDIISNPENLIPTLQKQKVDLILMDINLPGASGVELTKQIRKLPGKKFKNLPIIALTGKLFPEDLKTYKKAKINDVITKPFNESTLINTINNYLK